MYVTDRGRELLKSRESVTLIRQAPPAAAAAGEFDAALFEKLRALRKRLADDMELPAFVVFSDAALRQMASHAPLDRDSLLRMKGVGEAKLRQYGDRFIAIIREHAGAPGDGLSSGTPHTAGRTPLGETYARTLELVREGLNVAEVAERRGISQRTVLAHMERLTDEGESFDMAHILPPPHRYVRIAHALRAANSDLLAPVMERLGHRYSFEELRLVRLHLRQLSAGRGGG